MTEPNNKWIGDFHKALEERKEPPKQFTPPSPKEATNPFLNHPVPDWVKKMGGALTESDFRRITSTFPTRVDGAMYGRPTLPEGMSYFDLSYRVSADVVARIGNGDHHKGYARLNEAVSNLVATARINDVIARVTPPLRVSPDRFLLDGSSNG